MRELPANKKTLARGFSLIEMAMVLLIVSLLTSGLLVAISNGASTVRETNTQALLEQIEEALYGFAQANGRLPCPANDISEGEEDCTINHGFVPAISLGIYGSINEDSLLLDAWQNPITYSVFDDFTSSGGVKSLFDNPSSLDGIEVCEGSASGLCTGSTLADNIPAIVISMGPNWASFSADNEIENAEDEDAYPPYTVPDDYLFVKAGYSEDNYDDQLLWLSPYILFSRLIKAGQLPL